MQETLEMLVLPLGQEDPLEEGMATHSSILARESPAQKILVGFSEVQSTVTSPILFIHLFTHSKMDSSPHCIHTAPAKAIIVFWTALFQ